MEEKIRFRAFPVKPRGQWVPLPYGNVYVSPIRGFQRFVGMRPKSQCNYKSARLCKEDPACIWVPSQQYCRGYPTSVSGGYTSQVWYKPRYNEGFSRCAHRSREDCLANGCQWIEWFTNTGEGSAFCRGASLSAKPYSMKFLS